MNAAASHPVDEALRRKDCGWSNREVNVMSEEVRPLACGPSGLLIKVEYRYLFFSFLAQFTGRWTFFQRLKIPTEVCVSVESKQISVAVERAWSCVEVKSSSRRTSLIVCLSKKSHILYLFLYVKVLLPKFKVKKHKYISNDYYRF